MKQASIGPRDGDGQGYFVEWNGDCWQSVFPESEARKSQLHQTWKDAVACMTRECGVHGECISVVPRLDRNGHAWYAP
jgi:hypothetical protein